MKPRGALVLVVAALVGIVAWLLWSAAGTRRDTLGARAHAASTATAHTTVPVSAIDQAPPEPRSELADQLNAPNGTIQADLRIVGEIIDAYRSNFHENPVGTNAEITAALMGHNRLQLALIPPGHPAVNLKGELCDRWGRPFFFHQISGTWMELRSSGPDRQMWTDDDIVAHPASER